MGVEEAGENCIMSGIENAGSIKQHKRKLRQRFDIIKKLGQGTFGKVQLGINKETGQEVAVKTIKKSKIESDADLVRIRREIQIMSSVQHPNIIHIYEVFENREKMVLVMEYAAGGELYDYLSERKVLPEDEARRIFRQIATACYYCHKHKICHRDLKLENILLDENYNAKIADFGLSNVFDDQRLLSTFCGSPLYASPEIVKGTPYNGPEVDCWSLGVLLYTLVYGAMPFDGSNFKRLVKQICQGDYYEPSKPSPASPLIRDMLTVNPRKRSSIEKICSHWWVNETYDIDCLEVSEELANQTPVRLDVLLALAPPAPQLESEKLVVTGDVTEDTAPGDVLVPTRSQSVGSLMELSVPERRIMDLINEGKLAPKRKLETTVSTDRANLLKRKDKIIKENTVADISVHGTIKENDSQEDISMSEALPLNKSLTQTISKPMEIDPTSIEGAACKELIEEAKEKEALRESQEVAAVKMEPTQQVKNSVNETALTSQKSGENNIDKENDSKVHQPSSAKKTEEKTGAKKKTVNKKVLADKNVNEKDTKAVENVKEKPVINKDKKVEDKQAKENGVAPLEEPKPTKVEKVEDKPVERRKSRIFEAAEKFQNMITPNEATKPVPPEKPKKILIPDSMVTQPGVSVDGFKKEFERKASLTSIVPPKLKTSQAPKKTLIDKPKVKDENKSNSPEKETKKSSNDSQEIKTPVTSPSKANKSEAPESVKPTADATKEVKIDDDRKQKVKNAVSIISNALDKEGTRKSKSRPCIMRKPPVPFGFSGRSASGNIETLTSLNSPVRNVAPKPFVRPCYENKLSANEAKQVKHEPSPPKVEEQKTSSAEITLKSATLPRRKTTKAQIQLNYPNTKPAQMGFRTEASHNVEAPQQIKSEVVVPVVGTPTPIVDFRASNDPQDVRSSKERIIPIAFERKENNKESVQSPPPTKPPMPKPFQSQRSNISQKSNSLSRQSTQDSDSETTTSTGEPIKKSAREYIIPIAVEGGGYVTPRASSLEPTDSNSTTSTMTGRSKSRWGSRRLNSLLNDRDSEDETPFSTLHRHSSFGKDSDNEDSKKDNFHHMHRLRSTRPKKATLEHTDSLSSGEDDDEGFEILTAENLFSTLLSRVRDLTQRLNVEDGVRPGFPSSRLLSHFDHGTNFWNRMDNPLTRHSSLGRTFSRPSTLKSPTSKTTFGGVPWRRSVSRDLASDIESVFNDSNNPSASTTSSTARVPRGDDDDTSNHTESLNLAELDLNKLNLSKEDQLALSHLTPGLSKRIQKQLLAQLTPAEVRSLHRTLSSKSSGEICDRSASDASHKIRTDKMSSTLPRKIRIDKRLVNEDATKRSNEGHAIKSFLPVKSISSKDDCEFNIRSSSIGDEPIGAYRFPKFRPKLSRSISTREPRIPRPSTDLYSPDSSISENLSRNDDTSISSIGSKYSILSRPYSKYSSDSSYSKYSPNGTISDPIDKKILQSPRKISRFLRPDFYESKEENVYVKEKKERERETQQVLKEIRDKRKNRLRSRSRGGTETEEILNKLPSKLEEPEEEVVRGRPQDNDKLDISFDSNKRIHDYVNVSGEKNEANLSKNDNDETDLNAVDVKPLHDYVNIKSPESTVPLINKGSKISRLVRPKSYPNETIERARKKSNNNNNNNNNKNTGVTEEVSESNAPVNKTDRKELKIRKLKTGLLIKKDKPSKEDKDATNKNINEEDKVQKNKLLQSIEKKLEKFRLNNTVKNPDEAKALLEKKSVVESAIKRLREQSLPRNLEPCTESGLIKRAVSVEDLAVGTKPLQASKKSVTKILGLFKKYEEQDKKKDKIVKKEKNKETKLKGKLVNGSDDNKSNISKSSSEITDMSDKREITEKKERPKSLLLGKMRHFQGITNRNDSSNQTDNKKSKLPINSFRRSLNLEECKDTNKILVVDNDKKPDRSALKLDLNQPSSDNCLLLNSPIQNNRNSLLTATTDDSCSIILSPADECLSCDSWSACSDFHHLSDLHSPQSQVNNNCHNSLCSGDEGESVSDRIRRKSFYTRFNEKKKPKKSNLIGMYKDLDNTYGRNSIDRFQSPTVSRRASFNSYLPETSKSVSPTVPTSPREYYKAYGRSVPVFNDYVNVPGGQYNLLHSYQNVPGTHSSLIGSYQNLPSSYQTSSNNRTIKPRNLYSDSDGHLDDFLKTAIPRRHSPYSHRSTLDRGSISPVSEHYFPDKVSTSIQSPTTSEPF